MRTSPYLGITVGQEQTREVECLYPMRFYALPLIGILTTSLVWAAETPVDFNREVRPILSDRCYGCHGPDADKGRKASFCARSSGWTGERGKAARKRWAC